MDCGVKIGALGGGLLGLLFGGFIFPLAGLLTGALAGGIIGKMVKMGVDPEYVKEGPDSLQLGTSAQFIVIRSAYPDAALVTLKPSKGQVCHTSQKTELEENLRRYLRRREELTACFR